MSGKNVKYFRKLRGSAKRNGGKVVITWFELFLSRFVLGQADSCERKGTDVVSFDLVTNRMNLVAQIQV